MKIKKIIAREVLDSRGNPTVEAEVTTDKGFVGRAIVPSGASTGTREALELRDNDKNRYLGKGVLKAVHNVNTKIALVLKGESAASQKKLDQIMLDLDGTESKTKLGANAILSVSVACARAAANERKLPLYEYIAKTFKVEKKMKYLPTPMMNIINGGAHADNGIDFQEFLIMPINFKKFSTALKCGVEVFHTLKQILKKDKYNTSVGDEGGFAPNLKRNEDALKYIVKAISAAGYRPGIDVVIAIDFAASSMWNERKKKYAYNGKFVTPKKLLFEYIKLLEKYPIASFEDPFDEADWASTIEFTKLMGNRLQIIGDDNFVTNKLILQKGIEQGSCNSILIKINQIGTLTETFETIQLAKDNGYSTVISHRSGETEDTTIADLAVGWNLGQIKTGSLSRTDRVAKYNQLLRIEEMTKLIYPGKTTIKNFKI